MEFTPALLHAWGMWTLFFFLISSAFPAPTSASSSGAGSKDQARLYIGQQTIAPKEVNDVLKTQGMASFSKLYKFGLEVTHRVAPALNFGIRGGGTYVKAYELAATPAVPLNRYYSSIQQSQLEGIMRIDVVNQANFRTDIFAGVGVASTRMDIRNASGEGNYQHDLTSTFENAGVSAGVGLGNVYLTIEGGMEWSKVGNFVRAGTTSTSIQNLDLSGPYGLVGLTFNGVPSFIKQGSK